MTLHWQSLVQAHCIRKPNSRTFWQRFKDSVSFQRLPRSWKPGKNSRTLKDRQKPWNIYKAGFWTEQGPHILTIVCRNQQKGIVKRKMTEKGSNGQIHSPSIEHGSHNCKCGAKHRVTTCHRSWRHRRLETERWPPLKSINWNATWLVIEQAWHTKFAVIG